MHEVRKGEGKMLEIKGKYGKATIHTDNIGQETISQVYGLLNTPLAENANIQIMPDCHAGAGCVIGTTMIIEDKVCPNLVGVDIGCGVLTTELGMIDIDFEKLDEFIKSNIPSGFSVNSNESNSARMDVEGLIVSDVVSNKERIYKSLGTLGGGNHFIEIDTDDNGVKYLLVHTGSRNLGLQVANIYQKLATDITEKQAVKKNELINQLKKDGRESEIEQAIKGIEKRQWDKSLDYLTGKDLNDYLHDMEICQEFASENRKIISLKIANFLKVQIKDWFDTVHNYIDTKHRILRKGAVSAQEYQRLIIPINMRDGALICTGKGNIEWNNSAPHGAGRILSRSQAKRDLKLEDFQKTMNGIYTTTATQATIDEAPMAYKPIDEIIENIKDTVTINKIIKPIYNFKACE